jgi:hypothetical protein
LSTTATSPAWLDGAGKVAAIISGALTSAGAVCAVLIWMSGGFEPGTKVMADTLKAQITDLQGQIKGLNGTMKGLQDRIDAMPRAADMAAQAERVSRLEGVMSAFGDRLGRDEVDAARVSTRVDRLEAGSGAAVRLPR